MSPTPFHETPIQRLQRLYDEQYPRRAADDDDKCGGRNTLTRRTTMGEVKEQTWTCIAASYEGADGNEVVDATAIGRRTTTRRAYFAFKAEAEAWLDEQAAEGFRPEGGIASAATFYHGPTDAPGNCWFVTVERDQPLAKLAPGELDPRD